MAALFSPTALHSAKSFAKGLEQVFDKAAANLPNVKVLPDLSAMVIEYGNLRATKSDDAYFPPIQEEIERLQVCEYDLGEIMEAEQAARWALSLPKVQAALAECGPEAVAAVARLFEVLGEAS